MTKQNKEPKKITSGEETSSYVNFLNIGVEQEKYRKAWPDVMKFVEQYPNVLYDNEFVEVSIDGRKELYFAYTKMIDEYKEKDTIALNSDLTIKEILSKILKYVNFKEDGTCMDVDRKRFERDSRKHSEMRLKLKIRDESIELISDVMVHCFDNFLSAENTFKKVYAFVHEAKKIKPSTWLDSAMGFIVKAVNYEPYCYFWNLLQNLQPVLIDRKLSPSETEKEIKKIEERFCGKDDKQRLEKAEEEEGEAKKPDNKKIKNLKQKLRDKVNAGKIEKKDALKIREIINTANRSNWIELLGDNDFFIKIKKETIHLIIFKSLELADEQNENLVAQEIENLFEIAKRELGIIFEISPSL